MSIIFQPLRVEILRYNQVLSLSNILSNRWTFRQIMETLADDVANSYNTSNLATLSIFPGLLEQYNIRYTEKWVRRIDENFLEYYHGLRPALNVPPIRTSSRRLSYLYDKFFSGDVSGMIAESLFIYLLDHLGININLVGHLRPLKRKNAFLPDFVIWDTSKAVGSLVQSTSIQPPLYAEVKGSTGNIDKNRIAKAITQLHKVITQTTACGILFLVFRESQTMVYTGTIIEVVL